MPADRVADDVEKQLFPEEWRGGLKQQLGEGIESCCPYCNDIISFKLDDASGDAEMIQTVTDGLLMRGMWVVQIEDDDCVREEDRKKPFYRVLTLGGDRKIQASTLMPDAMPEFLEDSARAKAIAERSAAKISEMAADVRALLRCTLTSNFGVPEENLGSLSDVELVAALNRCRGDAEDAARTAGIAEGARTAIGRILLERWDVPKKNLDGVPDTELMEIFDGLFDNVIEFIETNESESEEAGKRLVALLGDRATADDRDPAKTSLKALVDRVWAVHGKFVETIAAAIGVDLTQDAAADTKAILERLQDLASNDPDTVIKIGVALGMDESDMRQKMLATLTTNGGDEKAARAELAKSVTDTARVMLARFRYACEAAGLDKQTRDGDPRTAMLALSAIIGANRLVAAARRR